MAEVPLAEAIANLRSELQSAMADGQEEQLKFELDSVVLELDVAISTGAGTGVKAGFWSVVTAEASADHRRGATHRLTLTLTPHLSGTTDGQRVRVGDEMSVRPPAVRPE